MKLCKDCKYRGRWFDENKCKHPNAIKERDYIANDHTYYNCNSFRGMTKNNGLTACGFNAKFFEPTKFKKLKDWINENKRYNNNRNTKRSNNI